LARRAKEAGSPASDSGPTSEVLTDLIIRDLNRDAEGGKIAWNLATDLDDPTSVKEFISTQSTLLDTIIANKLGGGVPVGKLTEVCGEEASGKSLLCAHLIAECQKRGGIAVYIDTENACSPDFLKQLGVDISKMAYVQPQTIEAVGSAIEQVIVNIRTKAPNKLCLIIWDSVAGTPSQAEIDGEFTIDMNAALQNAKAIAKMMRKLTQVWGKERIAMVFTNQLKTKIGVKYGDPMGTTGGKAIPYHSSVRVRLNKVSQLAEGAPKKDGSKEAPDDGGGEEAEAKGKGAVYGIHTRAKTIKNRLGPPMRSCEFDITFSHGIDDVASWFPFLNGRGEIEKASGWCYYTAIPSGEVSKWNADKQEHEGDRGLQFREKGWPQLIASDPRVRERALADIAKHLIVRYDGKPVVGLDVDPDSLMDAEGVEELGK
jgi:recombination protein RecA